MPRIIAVNLQSWYDVYHIGLFRYPILQIKDGRTGLPLTVSLVPRCELDSEHDKHGVLNGVEDAPIPCTQPVKVCRVP